jgi:hypothetical protein
MKGLISFHPADPAFFRGLVQPLCAGEPIDQEPFLARALGLRMGAWTSRRYVVTLERLLGMSTPPPPPSQGSLWEKLRARLEVFDFKADPLATLVRKTIEPELHLHGRPFLIADGSPEAVAEAVDAYREAGSAGVADSLATRELRRIHPELAEQVGPDPECEPPPELTYRAELSEACKEIRELSHAAREGATWDAGAGERRPAAGFLAEWLPWRAAWLHSRAMPFWQARDVDGLETICRAAGVTPPESLVPALALFGDLVDEFPKLADSLHHELESSRDVGGYVAPEHVPALVEFLKARGARIIQVAARHGEGPRCQRLLRKIRECASYAERHGLGYLEAAGIAPVGPTVED